MNESPTPVSANSSGASELRIDALSGHAVIIAPARSLRPGAELPAGARANLATEGAANADEFRDDPFLEGREHLTPAELFALRPCETAANTPGWSLRVVPNRFPAVNVGDGPTPQAQSSEGSLLRSHPLSGHHEVVIECPDFRTRLSDLTATEVRNMLRAWQARVRALQTDSETRWIGIFRNEGTAAGASLSHCHSQILSVPFVPDAIEQRVARALQHRQQSGRCLTHDWLKTELDSDARLLASDERITSLCPFASMRAWQVRFVATGPSPAAFADCSADVLDALSDHLRHSLRAVDSIVPNFAFNLALTLPPVARPDAFPWLLDLLPRTTGIAGFELLSRCDINPVPPEHAAKRLREVLNADPGTAAT